MSSRNPISACNTLHIVPLLSTITSESFFNMSFRISVRNADEISNFFWKELNGIFNHHQPFANIRRILVDMICTNLDIIPSEFMEEVREMMFPELDQTAQRGVLEVKYKPLSELRAVSRLRHELGRCEY